MENKHAGWIAGIVGLVAVALAIGVAIANSGSGDLTDTTWTLRAIADPAGGALTAPIPDVPVTAEFDGSEVTGNAGCNSYFGGYQTDGDAISIGPLGVTQAFCEGIQDQEDRYLTLLQSATTYAVDGSKLTLSEGGTTLLEFDG